MAFAFTAVISIEPLGEKTKYSALVIHGDEETKNKHAAMGFHTGWSAAFDQLVKIIQKGTAPH